MKKTTIIWIIVGILVVGLLFVGVYSVVRNDTRNKVTQEQTEAAKDQELADLKAEVEQLKNAAVSAPTANPAPVAAAATTITDDSSYITVYRGDTDEQTINFDDHWPTYAPTDAIDWTSSSFHMGGGTYTVQADGIISGDVKVNGVAIYDNDENTFLVVNVKKGDKVTVNSDWLAWFTSYYKEDLVVAARQAAHPTWTRQWSALN